ncbi:MAG: hypothetical protein P8Z30_20115 [Acidobacteriota bacterium]
MKRIMIIGLQLAVLAGLSGLVAFAQTEESPTQTEVIVEAKPLTESDIELLRQDVQSKKMEIITAAMNFTDAEASAFWPVYRDYANQQQKMGDKKYQIIKEYAANYDNMSNAKAAELTQQMFQLDKATFENRTAYWPRFEKVLGAKRAAKFFQVDRRLSLMIDLELSTDIPILP